MIAPTEPGTLAAEDFAFLAAMLRERAAIVLEPGKEYLALSRLDPLAREIGCGSVTALIDILRLEPAESPMHDRVVDALTTNETTFFRDLEPFESLRTTVLPEVIERRARTKTLAIWSAGCSTGQEPYSIAMTIREHFPELASWNLSILGTDISPTVLERARHGGQRCLPPGGSRGGSRPPNHRARHPQAAAPHHGPGLRLHATPGREARGPARPAPVGDAAAQAHPHPAKGRAPLRLPRDAGPRGKAGQLPTLSSMSYF